MIGGYLQAFIRRYAGAAWQSVVPGTDSDPVKRVFTHDPEQYDFNVDHLPALYVFSAGSAAKPETIAEDIRVTANRLRVFWIIPPADQFKQAERSRAISIIADIIDGAIQRGRDPSFVVDDDPDPTAPFEGSVLLRHAGLMSAEGGQWTPGRIGIKAPGNMKSQGIELGLFDGLQTEIIIRKRKRELFAADADHPEWGPSAGNALSGPAQLELSINGEPAATFLVGYTMLYILNGAAAQAIGTTPAKFVGFDGQGQAAGVLPDHASDRITVENRGTYSVVAALSVSGTAGVVATLRCRKNGVPVDGLRGDVTLAAGVQNLAVIGQVGCDQSDVLELWIEAAGSGSLTAASGTFAIARV